MKMKWIFMVAFLVAQIIPFSAMAQDSSKQEYLQDQKQKSAYWIGSLGFDFGGEEMITMQYDDGSESDIRAGELLNLSTGVVFPNGASGFETQLTVGWKSDSSTAENGDVSFTRFPIEVLEFYTLNMFRFGGGITYHLRPTLDGSGFAGNIEADFDNALGFVVQFDMLYKGFTAGLRYTSIEYKLEDYDVNVDGNSFGFFIGFRL